MKEKELSLVDLIFDMLLHWRGILVSVVIGAVLLGGFSFLQSSRTHDAQTARVEAAKLQLMEEMQQAVSGAESGSNTEAVSGAENGSADGTGDSEQLTADAASDSSASLVQLSLEWLENRITETQKHNVNYVLTYEQLYLDKLTYEEQSVLMRIDPNHVQKGEVTFLVTAQTEEAADQLVDYYEDLVLSGEMLAEVAAQLGVEPSMVSETIRLERDSSDMQRGTNLVRVEVVHYDAETCGRIQQALIDYVKEQSRSLTADLGSHKVTVLSQSQVEVIDTEIMDHQNAYLADIAAIEETIVNSRSKFSKIEWQYYDYMLNGKITELSSSIEESLSEGSVADGEADDLELLTDIINEGVTVYPGISMKYVILGGILGAFLYVFVLFLKYILNTRVRMSDDLGSLYGISALGMIEKEEKRGRLFGFIDRLLLSIRDRNRRKFTGQEALELAAVAVGMEAAGAGLDTVYLVGCDVKGDTLAVCRSLQKTLEEKGIHAEILNNVLYDAGALGSLRAKQGAVLVETAGVTLYREITQELELFNRLQIGVLGGILVE